MEGLSFPRISFTSYLTTVFLFFSSINTLLLKMKKLSVAFLLLVLSHYASAQQAPNIVKYNLGALLERTFSAGFERAVSPKNSIQITLDYHTEKDRDYLGGDRYTGVGLSGEYRIYGLIPALKTGDETVLNGVFFGPSAAYRRITYKSRDRKDPFDERFSVVQLGGVAGYQYRPRNLPQLSAEASLGLMLGFASGEDVEGFGEEFGIGTRFNSGFVPVFSLNIGYAFGR